MSNFTCDKCNTDCIDSPAGYVSGCIHYPADCCVKCGLLIGSAYQIQNPGADVCGKCAELNQEEGR